MILSIQENTIKLYQKTISDVIENTAFMDLEDCCYYRCWLESDFYSEYSETKKRPRYYFRGLSKYQDIILLYLRLQHLLQVLFHLQQYHLLKLHLQVRCRQRSGLLQRL